MVGARSKDQHNLRICLLGPFDVQIEGRAMPRFRSRKERLLLALLVLRHGREVRRDWLAETLWPDSRIDQSLAYLRQSLCLLRRAMGSQAGRLQATVHWLRLDIDGADVDFVKFDAAIVRGDDASLQVAIGLYTGPLLEGCTETWAVNEQRLREQRWLLALEKLAEIERTHGRFREASALLHRLIRHDPLRESAHRALMLTLADSGDYAAMTTVYRDLRIMLRQEANLDPSPESIALYEQLRIRLQRPRELGAVAIQSASQPHPVTPLSTSSDAAEDDTVDQKAPTAVSYPLPILGPPSAISTSTLLLPRPLTSLIGRREAVHEIIDSLGRTHLLTLTGTGGVGKTRLALQTAQEWSSRGDVWFVELASLSNPTLVPQAVASAFRLTEEVGVSVEDALGRSLAHHAGLLVLDNCEHLLDAVSGFVSHLLQACSELRILATSRQALGISGEALFAVPTMQTPPLSIAHETSNETDWLSRLNGYEAIQLFSERATAVMPTFRLTAQNAGAVLDVCRALDGIPLAIELAAAWSSVLTPEQMLATITQGRFQLLVSRKRDPDARHRSLWATLDASCQLLEPPLRHFLARTSVFRGGWTLEAAEAVCLPALESGASTVPVKRAFGFLALLQERSLIQTHSSGTTMRYSLLDTVREYASELLTSEDRDGISHAHMACFLALAEEGAPHLIGPQQVKWLDRLEEEQYNIGAALTWCARNSDQSESGLRMCTALWRFWDVRGHHQEGIEWISTFQSRDQTAPAEMRASIQEAIGLLHGGNFDAELSRHWSLEALTIYTEIGDEMGVARTRCTVGISETNLGRAESARVQFLACLPYLERSDNAYELGRAQSGLGMLELYLRIFDKAIPLLHHAADNYRVCGHLRGVAHTLYRLGGIAMVHSQFDRAHNLFLEALSLTREIKDRTTLAFGLFHIGRNSFLQQDFSRARMYLREALDYGRADRSNAVEGTCLLILGDIALNQQDVKAACTNYTNALTAYHRLPTAAGVSLVGSRLIPIMIAQNRATEALCLAAYATCNLVTRRAPDPPDAFMLYMSLGYYNLDPDIFEDYITTLRALLPGKFDAIWTEAQTMTQQDGFYYVRNIAHQLSVLD